MSPRVSFVIPSHNYGRYLPEAIESLLGQTYPDLEVLIVDDASTDDSVAIAEGYLTDGRVRLVRHAENKGNIATYNDGLQAATGDLIGLLSADDFAARPDAVERQVAVFEANPTVGFVHTAFDIVDDASTPVDSFDPSPADSVRAGLDEFVRLCFDCYVSASGTLVRTSCHTAVGYYDPRLPVSADWDLWLRLSTRFDVGYVADRSYAYRIHPSNMHHKTVSSHLATRNHVETIERAFARLPPEAPESVRRLRKQAVENAHFVYSRDARSRGRPAQSWSGLVDSVRWRPSLLTSRSVYGEVVRTAALGVLGQDRYSTWRRRMVDGESALPGTGRAGPVGTHGEGNSTAS